jgi:hypothetical protein
MVERAARWTAAGCAATTCAIAVAAPLLARGLEGAPGVPHAVLHPQDVLIPPVYALTGAALVWLRTRNAVGWILLTIGVCGMSGTFLGVYGIPGIRLRCGAAGARDRVVAGVVAVAADAVPAADAAAVVVSDGAFAVAAVAAGGDLHRGRAGRPGAGYGVHRRIAARLARRCPAAAGSASCRADAAHGARVRPACGDLGGVYRQRSVAVVAREGARAGPAGVAADRHDGRRRVGVHRAGGVGVQRRAGRRPDGGRGRGAALRAARHRGRPASGAALRPAHPAGRCRLRRDHRRRVGAAADRPAADLHRRRGRGGRSGARARPVAAIRRAAARRRGRRPAGGGEPGRPCGRGRRRRRADLPGTGLGRRGRRRAVCGPARRTRRDRRTATPGRRRPVPDDGRDPAQLRRGTSLGGWKSPPRPAG